MEVAIIRRRTSVLLAIPFALFAAAVYFLRSRRLPRSSSPETREPSATPTTRDDETPRVIAIDWSGAKTGSRNKIFLAEAVDGRLLTLEDGRTRDQLVDHLMELAREHPNLIVGLDFAFSLPSWFLTDRGLDRAHALWALADQEAESWLDTCEPPFWGAKDRKRPDMTDDQHFRKTEREVPDQAGIRPKSVFQILGRGAVGTGSLRGMPYLLRLHDAGFSIWPFDPPGPHTVVEIWPRLLTGPVNKSSSADRAAYLQRLDQALSPEDFLSASESDDAFDAAVSAISMSQHLKELTNLPEVSDRRALLEGIIWHPDVRQVSD